MANMIPVKQAALKLGKSATTIKRYCARGMPHDRLGPNGGYRVDVEEARCWLAEKKARDLEARRVQWETTKSKPQQVDSPKPQVEVEQQPAVDMKQDEPGPDSEPVQPARVQRRPRAPVRPGGTEPVSANPAAPESRPLDADLDRAVQLQSVLAKARSVSVERIPNDIGDVAIWATADLQPFVGIAKADLAQAIQRGGLKVLLQERLGPGKFRLAWIGSGGVVLHSEEIEIPSLQKAYAEFQAEKNAKEMLERDRALKARKQAKEERRLAKEEAKLQKAEKQEARRATAVHRDQVVWDLDCADVGVREAACRVRYAGAYLLDLLQVGSRAYGRRVAELGREADRLRREAERLERLRELEEAEEEEEEEEEEEHDQVNRRSRRRRRPRARRRSVDDLGRDPQDELIKELKRIRDTDLEALRGRLQRYLWEQRERLFPLPPWDPRVWAALEPLLPQVPDPRYRPWAGLFPPAPPTWGGPAQHHGPAQPVHGWAPGPRPEGRLAPGYRQAGQGPRPERKAGARSAGASKTRPRSGKSKSMAKAKAG